MFKHKKIKKKFLHEKINLKHQFDKLKKQKNILTLSITILSVFFIFLIGFGITKQISNIKFNLDFLLNLSGFELKFEEFKKNTPIKKSDDGKTNILIIGRGGEENEAPELTDSILIASINYNLNTVSMFSIPRDLYVEFPTGQAGKINEAYFRGLKKYKNEFEAISPLKEILTKITGEEIHYFVNIDFNGFRKIIDTIGGIDINIPADIVDTTYPGPNFSYQTFRIKAGPQTLDGETALKYARTRHTTSDFDRSLRQQLIIKAIREKILSLGLLTNPSKIKSLYLIVKEHIITDLDISQIINLALFLKDIPKENIISSNLNDSCFYGSDKCEKGGFLYVPLRSDFGGASVLLQNGATKNNISNYDSLMKYTNLVFNYPLIYTENLKINVLNSTKVPGLAKSVSENLKKYGFNIPKYNSLGNTGNDKYEKSKILYKSFSGGIKPKTIEALELFIFGGSQVETLPKYSKDPDVDIEIIIGNDYKFLNF